MTDFLWRVVIIVILAQASLIAAAQDGAIIVGANVGRLRSVERIDFADIGDDLEIGWFEANEDASEFVVFDSDGRIYRVGVGGVIDSWTYRGNAAQVFSLIDAVYATGGPLVFYLLDGAYFVNDRQLQVDDFPVAAHLIEQSLFVEAVTTSGATVYHELSLAAADGVIRPDRTIALPGSDAVNPGVLIGRVDFPHAIVSRLADGQLSVYRYPYAFSVEGGREYRLDGGPAVAGALNAGGSHFAWSDPASERLNALDLGSGENKVVAELGGAYAQYLLLTADASAIIAVNVDFEAAVFAWVVESGERLDLGAYRECKRIPDRVALSADGAALVIGCDTGLDIWRIASDEAR